MAESCDICKSDNMEPSVEVSLLGLLAVWVHRCQVCGFRQIRPRLTRQELAVIYPDQYFDSAQEIGYCDYDRQAQRYERVAYFLAKRIRRLVPPQGRLLEVGCALGFLLHALQGYTSLHVQGLDVSPFAAYFARRMYGLDVACGTLGEARFPTGHFDFMIQKDLLEHVTHPREHLLESGRILKRGGYMWLITPNGEANIRPLQYLSGVSRNAGKDELPLMEQGHLSFFSKEHLLRLFFETGFECVSLRNISIRRGLRAFGILPRKKKTLKTIKRSDIHCPRPSDETDLAHEAGLADEAEPAQGGGPGDPEAHFQRLYAQISREIGARRSPIRSLVPYFYQRELLLMLDRLPARCTIGLDFEFLLRRA